MLYVLKSLCDRFRFPVIICTCLKHFSLQLLRNIQLLLDASVALMNQYSTVTARLPVIPTGIPPVVPAPTIIPPTDNNIATTSTAPTDFKQSTTAASSSVSDLPSTSAATASSGSAAAVENVTIDDDLVKIEDLGSEEHFDLVNTTASTSNATSSGDFVEANELRRRRLEKFLNSEQKND